MTVVFSATDDNGLNKAMFLGTNAATLEKFGLRMPWKIVTDGEVWRLVLPLFVNHGFLTMAINTVVQLILGFILEKALGVYRMATFYLAVGISANVIGAWGTSWYATGPEPAIYGELGGLIGAYIFYWNNILCSCCQKILGFFGLLVLTAFAVFVMVASTESMRGYSQALRIALPDTWGCIGGFICGFFLVWAFLPPVASQPFSKRQLREKVLLLVGLMVYLAVIVACLVSLFTGKR